MIIYCAGPIKGNTEFKDNYSKVVEVVESLGHTALSEMSKKFHSSIPLSPKQVYARDMKWLEGSKLMIAEISGPSLGVGFEIAYALFVKKINVLALYSSDAPNLSSMITGCNNPKLSISKYTNADDLTKIINDFIVKYGSN
ncbi:MAG TPA: nucleoside 2-deoxyribosyltransferase [Ignavibacteriaceae bacterium]|jgi:hypothetical protein|nr:MAG: Nucleoside 2-deoxyribosyltransferase [Ignavibacteria bacterium ADurb.Bin266]OQY74990.1 MAG: hypothetical protein B6D44_02940 [Ignavibacteriales bacterium UTCHB2]HQF43388.1 nucleoside 2-deoxyribosyltransferase [Ignavibacteriaceae bacterium]HQI39468.1 nucleoside 2-deoxyribosyltransferase [Ignavibacteriaceae bacterium]HQJ45362.1 nucleoside 2-deoxyribosyltransferase [Ignavibacteriaceae bacterium]